MTTPEGTKVRLVRGVNKDAFFVGRTGTVRVVLEADARGVVTIEGFTAYVRFEHPVHGPILVAIPEGDFSVASGK